MAEWLAMVLLFLAGTAAGTLNVLAGGGSMLTLPLLIFLGLPGAVANGTNRVAILVQNIGAVWGFHRHGILEWRWLLRLALPAALGAGLGSWVAVGVGDLAFRRILAVIMLAVAAWTLLDPLRGRPVAAAPPTPGRRAFLILAFFGVGFYGGFIQAGIGFLLLALMPLAGLDLVRGNALKVLVVLTFTPIALAVFAFNGKVDWGLGAALAAGNLTGSQLGVRLTLLMGHRGLKYLVTAVVVLFAVRLWWGG